MKFHKTNIPDAYVIEPSRINDHRGFFARIWCQNELRGLGLRTDVAQSNVGFSYLRGTLRGLHFQKPPHAEAKIVRCTLGSIFDVIVDLRPDSPTHKLWFGLELSGESGTMIYVPEGCAQGYITLADNTEMCYQTTAFYNPEYASGVRYDDPVFEIAWPTSVAVISDQDKAWPDYASRSLPHSKQNKGRR